MKKVLFISYYFPPTGGGGVQRSLKFVKYLPSFGYLPIVISAKSDFIHDKDYSLLSELNKEIDIHYLPSYNPILKLDFLKKIHSLIYNIVYMILYIIMIPEIEFFWYLLNRKKILQIAEYQNINLVYTTSLPLSAHLFGKYLKKKNPNIKWIADSRDPIVKNPSTWSRLLINKILINTYFQNMIAKKSDCLINVAESIKQDFVKMYKEKIDPSKFISINNGYDEDDFKEMDMKQPNTNSFNIVYMGRINWLRRPFTLLKGFYEFIKLKDKNEKTKIKITFIGRNLYKSKILKFCKKHKISNNIALIDYLPHKEMLHKMQEASIIAMIFADKKHTQFYPTGKIYELIRLNKPILGILPVSGEAAAIIKKTQTGKIADYNNINEIAYNIDQFYLQWKNGTIFENYNQCKNWSEVQQYERKALTKKLALVINKLENEND